MSIKYIGIVFILLSFTVQASDADIMYDPSGYVNDSQGNPVQNAEVILYNSTWTDPCTGTSHCWTDSNGFWNTNIYENGIYSYQITASDYVTLTGSKSFIAGSTGNNFTMTVDRGILAGNVYEWDVSVKPYHIRGVPIEYSSTSDSLTDADGTNEIRKGATLTYYGGYVWKFEDMMIGSDRAALFELLYDGSLVDHCIVKARETCKIAISEQESAVFYLTLYVESVFSGGSEVDRVDVKPGYSVKIKTNWYDYVNMFLFPANSQILKQMSIGISFGNIQSDKDLIRFWENLGYQQKRDFDKHPINSGNPCGGEGLFMGAYADNYYKLELSLPENGTFTTIDAWFVAGTSGTPRSVKYAYSDDQYNLPIGQVHFPESGMNEKSGIGNLCSQYNLDGYPFAQVDDNNNKKISFWLTFPAGGTETLVFYNIDFSASCLSCERKPLKDVRVYYYNGTSGVKEFSTDSDGKYTLDYTLGSAFKTYFEKKDYEKKNQTFIFTENNRSQLFDILINRTNATYDASIDQVWVTPSTYTYGQSAIASWEFRSLDHKNTEKRIVLHRFMEDNYLYTYEKVEDVSYDTVKGITAPGPYVIEAQWFDGIFGFGSWKLAAYNNFTVRASIPAVYWYSKDYYIGDIMILGVDVPSGVANQNVTVQYPNGTTFPGYPLEVTSAQGIQQIKISTVDSSGNQSLPAGQYVASITGAGNNYSVTKLWDRRVDEYELTGPSSARYGETVIIKYVSPKQSELRFSYPNGYQVIKPYIVQGFGEKAFNTSMAGNKQQVIKIELIQNRVPVKTLNLSINGQTTSAGQAANVGQNLLDFMSYPAFWGLIIWILAVAAVVQGKPGEDRSKSIELVAVIGAGLEALVGLWEPFTWWVVAIIIITLGTKFYAGRKVHGGEE